MKSENCPVCGTLCTIEGEVTRHYEPVKPTLRLPERKKSTDVYVHGIWIDGYNTAIDDAKELNK